MSVGTFFWHVVIPAERANLVTNPSFELGTVGWVGTGAGGGPYAVGSSTARQAFGAWAMTMPIAANGRGPTTSVTLTSGTAYTASAYVQITGTSGGSVQISLGGTSTTVPVGSAWQRVAVGTIATTTAARTMAVQASGPNGTLWMDGAQVEAGSITTYLDGAQDGCAWAGLPHESVSYRSGQSRAGGTLVPLAALGLRPETHAGVGVAPPITLIQPRAILDGGEFQGQRYDTRAFTLAATLTGTTVADLHQTRRRVIDALKIDRVSPQQPTRFLYTGAGGTVQIDAVYSGGLDITDMQVIDDRVEVQFTAADPTWRGLLDEGASLAPRTILGSVNYIAYRDPVGRWGTMGPSGTSIQNTGGASPEIYAINAERTGTVVIGGVFGTAGGTVSPALAMYAGGAWGTFAGGTTTAGVGIWALRWSPNRGTLFVGGLFTTAGGTQARYIAQWNGAGWGTLAGGTIQIAGIGASPGVESLAWAPDGRLVVCGAINAVAGTVSPSVAVWDGAAWGTLVGGTVGTTGPSGGCMLTTFGNGDLLVGGYGSFATVGGTTANSAIARYSWVDQQWGTYPAQIGTSDGIYGVAVTTDQQAYTMTSAQIYQLRPGGAGSIAGITLTSPRRVVADPRGRILAMGLRTTKGSTPVPLNAAYWNGYAWTPLDLAVSGGTTIDVAAWDSAGTLYAGGRIAGVGTASAVTQIVNSGMGDAYPILQMRNTSNGTARVYQLLNPTTGDEIYFNYVVLPGEIVTLDLRPGQKTVTSSTRGNLIPFGAVLGGSNLATWRLQSGTNLVNFFTDSGDVVVSISWTPRHPSIDGGAPASAPSA